LDGGELTVLIDVDGLSEFRRLVEIAPQIANRSARLAINQVSERKGLKLAREAMLSQVAFPSGYLNETAKSGDKRFRLAYKATDARLEAGINATQSPTPLARFSRDRAVFARGGKARQGVRVAIKPGQSVTLNRAFLLNLRNGNIGLGIRLRHGETLTNTVGAKVITSGPLAGVALLYGPSVDQVFRTVAVDISPAILEDLTVEFLRQFERQFKNANLTTA
jgi:hypothetical protein